MTIAPRSSSSPTPTGTASTWSLSRTALFPTPQLWILILWSPPYLFQHQPQLLLFLTPILSGLLWLATHRLHNLLWHCFLLLFLPVSWTLPLLVLNLVLCLTYLFFQWAACPFNSNPSSLTPFISSPVLLSSWKPLEKDKRACWHPPLHSFPSLLLAKQHYNYSLICISLKNPQFLLYLGHSDPHHLPLVALSSRFGLFFQLKHGLLRTYQYLIYLSTALIPQHFLPQEAQGD